LVSEHVPDRQSVSRGRPEGETDRRSLTDGDDEPRAVTSGSALRVYPDRDHLRRTCLLASTAGTRSTALDRDTHFLAGDVEPGAFGKVVFDYLRPFVVANAGLRSRGNER
jgi:hypothetical protein